MTACETESNHPMIDFYHLLAWCSYGFQIYGEFEDGNLFPESKLQTTAPYLQRQRIYRNFSEYRATERKARQINVRAWRAAVTSALVFRDAAGGSGILVELGHEPQFFILNIAFDRLGRWRRKSATRCKNESYGHQKGQIGA